MFRSLLWLRCSAFVQVLQLGVVLIGSNKCTSKCSLTALALVAINQIKDYKSYMEYQDGSVSLSVKMLFMELHPIAIQVRSS